ncbi:uncharacterized protein LOC114762397 [Neltuma alba]|uniref:uncharacterized protein LOC114762397 n=1 Tax=Neltuma alba TaxID=207710 RepID=UPI0010A3FFB2|nr:uncharacterized protein LOC114762397 [Prosopis alba]
MSRPLLSLAEFPRLHDRSRKTAEEADLLHRNKKKVRGTEDKEKEAGVEDTVRSFKDTLKGVDSMMEEGIDAEAVMEELKGGISIIEHPRGKITVPEFILSSKVVEHICKSFALSLIVKLLDWSLGLGKIEERLQRMWAKEGVVSVVDLRNDFFVVTFSNKADYDRVLTGGPSMIQDHYLIVRKWKRNFDMIVEPIEEVIVWVRLTDFPLEAYDEVILSAIGNRIGKTAKVDLSTSLLARGSYARIPVQVNLKEALLPRIIYEGKE